MKNKKIAKRKRRIKTEIPKKEDKQLLITKKLKIKEIKEESEATKILKMVNIKHLYSYALGKLLKCDSKVLHELKDDIMPFLLNKLMIKENNVIYKILTRLLIVYDNKMMLLKYFKSFEYSHKELIDKIVRLVIKVNPGLFSNIKEEVILLIKSENLKNELINNKCLDDLKILNK